MYRTHRQHSLLSSGGVPSFIGGLVVFVSAAFNAQAETGSILLFSKMIPQWWPICLVSKKDKK